MLCNYQEAHIFVNMSYKLNLNKSEKNYNALFEPKFIKICGVV